MKKDAGLPVFNLLVSVGDAILGDPSSLGINLRWIRKMKVSVQKSKENNAMERRCEWLMIENWSSDKWKNLWAVTVFYQD